MCVNYKPTAKAIVNALTGADTANTPDWPDEVWQDYAAPVVRAGEQGEPELIVGTYGMMPKRKMQPGMHLSTMNARRNHRREADVFEGMARGQDVPAANGMVL